MLFTVKTEKLSCKITEFHGLPSADPCRDRVVSIESGPITGLLCCEITCQKFGDSLCGGIGPTKNSTLKLVFWLLFCNTSTRQTFDNLRGGGIFFRLEKAVEVSHVLKTAF